MTITKNREEVVFRNPPDDERFAVILAGGDGMRLRQMTKKLTGREIPKQFCPVLSDDTLLTVTQKRVSFKFSREKIFYSLTRKHEEFYQQLLADVRTENKIIQSKNKGTTAAILYSLLRLSRLDPEASVAFFPSDHYVSDDQVFMDQIEKTFLEVTKKPEAIVLVGIKPNVPTSSYGWIEPCEITDADSNLEIQKVKRFWEKPSYSKATELIEKGCLWNSFVLVGKVKSFFRMFKEHLPTYYRLFCAGNITIGTSAEKITMHTIYQLIDNQNFSYDILEKCDENLFVLPSGGFVWSDLGEPKEVLLKMAQLGLKNRLLPATAA